MDEWEAMFRAVQHIARSTTDFSDGLKQACSFALSAPESFDDPYFWHRVQSDWSSRTAENVMAWGRSGLGRLGPGEVWQFVMLALGDCPEIFDLYSPGGQDMMSESALRDLLFAGTIVGAIKLEKCLVIEADDPFALLFDDRRYRLIGNHVEALQDELLSWETGSCNNNGYFHWLVFGSLGLLKPL